MLSMRVERRSDAFCAALSSGCSTRATSAGAYATSMLLWHVRKQYIKKASKQTRETKVMTALAML